MRHKIKIKEQNNNLLGGNLSFLALNLLIQLFCKYLTNLTLYVRYILLSSDPNRFFGAVWQRNPWCNHHWYS